MDLRNSDADEQFRRELREWLEAELPKLPPQPDRDDWDARRRWDTDWQRRLFDNGYAGLNWPVEYGGRDLPASQQLLFLEETTRARAPYVGVNLASVAKTPSPSGTNSPPANASSARLGPRICMTFSDGSR